MFETINLNDKTINSTYFKEYENKLLCQNYEKSQNDEESKKICLK